MILNDLKNIFIRITAEASIHRGLRVFDTDDTPLS